MTMECIPLDVAPEAKGICGTCQDPTHAPADKTANHPFTTRVLPTGYVLLIVPDECPACKDPISLHKYVELDQDGNVRGCDRSDAWLYL